MVKPVPYITSVESQARAAAMMRELGVADEGIEIMAPAAVGTVAHVGGLSPRLANILKQEALALGGDVALPVQAYDLGGGDSRALITATPDRLRLLVEKLALHQGELGELGYRLGVALDGHSRGMAGELDLPGALGQRPWQLMGILNVTPDSFYDGGDYISPEAALERAVLMADAGADIIDIGGESTRPGAAAVKEQEELARVLPAVEVVSGSLDVPVSIDTSKSGVARAALAAGATMINDVTGLEGDSRMVEVAAEFRCPVCIMHMRGSPREMQDSPSYTDVVSELVDYFYQRIDWAQRQGVDRENIIIDPGIGFGKNLEHNLNLLRDLDAFLSLGRPLLIGVSRKSFIGMVAGDEQEDRLPGTIAANVNAYGKGARIFRVHDVAENRQALKVAADTGAA